MVIRFTDAHSRLPVLMNFDRIETVSVIRNEIIRLRELGECAVEAKTADDFRSIYYGTKSQCIELLNEIHDAYIAGRLSFDI